jgi:mannose-6-phosphate isomerase-like protein (cupin superfamily)
MIVKVDGASSRGAYSLIEYSHAPGAPDPPAHLHQHSEEAFFVLEGQLSLTVDGTTLTLAAGESAVVPRGSVHQPGNTSDRPVRFVFISSPPMDEFFEAMSRLLAATGGRPSPDALRALGERDDSAFVDLPNVDVIQMDNEA